MSLKRLILIRHAKSSWDDDDMSDHDRPLNARGTRSAAALGQWLADQNYIPDQVICSTARRTVETWRGIGNALNADPEVEFNSALYLARAGKMLELLQSAEGDTVLMLGHNPGTASLASGLIARRPDHPHFGRYPTGATTVMRFDLSQWKGILPGSGQVENFIVPRDLTD